MWENTKLWKIVQPKEQMDLKGMRASNGAVGRPALGLTKHLAVANMDTPVDC